MHVPINGQWRDPFPIAVDGCGWRRDRRDFGLPEARKIAVQAAAEVTTGDVLPEGRPPTDTAQFAQLTQETRAEEAGVSRRTQQKLDALARRRPDLLDEVRAGRKSAHAVAGPS
jgi:hypothetical protein